MRHMRLSSCFLTVCLVLMLRNVPCGALKIYGVRRYAAECLYGDRGSVTPRFSWSIDGDHPGVKLLIEDGRGLLRPALKTESMHSCTGMVVVTKPKRSNNWPASARFQHSETDGAGLCQRCKKLGGVRRSQNAICRLRSSLGLCPAKREHPASYATGQKG